MQIKSFLFSWLPLSGGGTTRPIEICHRFQVQLGFQRLDFTQAIRLTNALLRGTFL
jgi:hypothetical protein